MYKNKPSGMSMYMPIVQGSALLRVATQPIDFAKQVLGFSESLDYSDTDSLQTPKETCEFPSSLEYRDPVETSDGEDEDEVTEKIDPETKLKIYSLNQVSMHDSFDDCWLVLYDKVR